MLRKVERGLERLREALSCSEIIKKPVVLQCVLSLIVFTLKLIF